MRCLSLMLAFALVLTTVPILTEGRASIGGLKMETGKTDFFDGGSYVAVRFGKDAWFAVIYGGEKQRHITFVSIITRHLGYANVHTRLGRNLGTEVPIRLKSVFGVRLLSLLEFEDQDGNGICNAIRTGEGLMPGTMEMSESVYKGVSLNTTWTRSDVHMVSNSTDGSVTLEFSLTATDLHYVNLSSGEVLTDQALDRLTFTFHLTARVVTKNLSVPVYNVGMRMSSRGRSESDYDVEEFSTRETKNVTKDVLIYSLKTDHLIEGWDFDPDNSSPHLLLETRTLLGNAVPEGVPKWMSLAFIRGLNRGARAHYETVTGDDTVCEDVADEMPHDTPKSLIGPRLRFDDGWHRIGTFSWITDVNVTTFNSTRALKMMYQIQGGRHMIITGEKGTFVGFGLIGGFSYPGGERIEHDPLLTVESVVTESQEKANRAVGLAILLPVAFIILVMALTVAVVLFRR